MIIGVWEVIIFDRIQCNICTKQVQRYDRTVSKQETSSATFQIGSI